MKSLLVKYKSVIKFILTFLIVYGALTFSYKLYLTFSTGENYYPDYLTNLVAKQSVSLLETAGYKAEIFPYPTHAYQMLIVNDKYVAKIVEGCNSISVIILFLSFIVAFSGRFKATVIYILAGSVIIYVANLLRVVILSIGLYHYPWRSEVLHSVVFPAMIYGMVFLLWMIWVKRYKKINLQDAK